jgi:hypothetical protein
MKKTEIILIPICLLLLVLALLDVPGMGPLMALFYPILSILYFWFGFALFNSIPVKRIFKRKSYTDIPSRNIVIATLMGMFISFIPIGILFKLQFWPGTSLFLKVGTYSTFLLCMVIQGFLFRNKSQTLTNLLKRGAVYGITGYAFFLMTDDELIDIVYCSHPDYAEIYKQHIVDRDNPVILAKKESLEQEIWGMKSRYSSVTKGKNQPVKISISQNLNLSITTLTIDPNGSIEIPGYWEQISYDELRNQITLEDSLGNDLCISKFPPEYSIGYTDGMTAEELVYAAYEHEKNAVEDYDILYVKVVDDSSRHFIIVKPTDEDVLPDNLLLGAKENFHYSFALGPTVLSEDEQIDFLRKLFLEN